MNGCIKELERLKTHYETNTHHPFDKGVVEGLKMAIAVLKNKEYYDKKA